MAFDQRAVCTRANAAVNTSCTDARGSAPVRCAVATAALVVLAGCTGGMSAMVQSVRQVVSGTGGANAVPPLDPKFEYLRVARGKHVALLWRGSVEQSERGPVDVYYSGGGEVVRLQNGRIVGALGLTTEWRRADVVAPPWTVASASPATRVLRTRDVMPGYISGLRDELTLRVVEPPKASGLQRLDPRSLTWFEEHMAVRPAAGGADHPLPTARYAVDLREGEGKVVYAEQCLAANLCFSWQRWSAALQQASTAPR
jgi:hypothetical protein